MTIKRITNKDIGKYCAIKNISVYETETPLLDKYVWIIQAIKTIKGKKYACLLNRMGGYGTTIWITPTNNIILPK